MENYLKKSRVALEFSVFLHAKVSLERNGSSSYLMFETEKLYRALSHKYKVIAEKYEQGGDLLVYLIQDAKNTEESVECPIMLSKMLWEFSLLIK